MALTYYEARYAAGGGDLPILVATFRGKSGRTKHPGLVLNYNAEFKCWDTMVRQPPAWRDHTWVTPVKGVPLAVRKLFKSIPDAELIHMSVRPVSGFSSVIYPPGPQLYDARLIWRLYPDLVQDESAQRDFITEAVRLLPEECNGFKPRHKGVIYVARRGLFMPLQEMDPRVPVNIGLLYFSEYPPDTFTAPLPSELRPLRKDLTAKTWKPRPYLMP